MRVHHCTSIDLSLVCSPQQVRDLNLGDTMSIHNGPWCLVDTLPMMQDILSVEWRPSEENWHTSEGKALLFLPCLWSRHCTPQLRFHHLFLTMGRVSWLCVHVRKTVCFVSVMLPFCFPKACLVGTHFDLFVFGVSGRLSGQGFSGFRGGMLEEPCKDFCFSLFLTV